MRDLLKKTFGGLYGTLDKMAVQSRPKDVAAA
eukprot:SAG11_NODE_53075_length_104_cov_344.200000_1_plen_31_part_10